MAFSGTDAHVIFVVWLASQANSARDTELLPSGELFLPFVFLGNERLLQCVTACLGCFGEYLLLAGKGKSLATDVAFGGFLFAILDGTESYFEY